MLTEMILTLLGVAAVARFWRTILFLLLSAVAVLMALGITTLAGWIIH
jgi:hypothetical protein